MLLVLRWLPHRRLAFFASALLPLALLFLPVAACALDPAKNIDQYDHDNWSSQNGSLPGEAVYQILQSSDGYLWLRMSVGLVRFDGARFVVVEPLVRNKPIEEPVAAICLGADGQLLVRTSSHTLVYKNGFFSDYLPPAPLPDGVIRSLFESRQHEIFIGSDDFIYLLDRATGKPRMLSRHTGWVDAFFEDSQRTVWIAGSTRLFQYRQGRFSVVSEMFHPHENWAFLPDNRDSLWDGATNGLFRVRQGENGITESLVRPAVAQVHALLKDREGNLWIGTADRGLIRDFHGKRVPFSASQGLTNNQVFAFYEDREGSVWVGTASGLDRFRDTKLTLTTREGLPSNNITAILKARDGTLFVSCRGGGLAQIRDGAVRPFGGSQPHDCLRLACFRLTTEVSGSEPASGSLAIRTAASPSIPAILTSKTITFPRLAKTTKLDHYY
jgi:ligand-binding sensor domain-containing protein